MAAERPCGLYRTTRPIGEDIPPGRLVYYHNHGDPGPGVYLPREWLNNRAIFHEKGTTIPDEAYAETLEALLEEGLYRVERAFFCCERRCQHFEEDLLVQLGYNGDAEPILFVPTMVDGAIRFPDSGTIVDQWQLKMLRALKVPVEEPGPEVLN